MTCKDICKREDFKLKYSVKYKAGNGNHAYIRGFYRCNRCEIFLKINDSYFCPCCKLKVRIKPNRKNSKRIYQEYQELVQQIGYLKKENLK